jgi:hypothetical protein
VRLQHNRWSEACHTVHPRCCASSLLAALSSAYVYVSSGPFVLQHFWILLFLSSNVIQLVEEMYRACCIRAPQLWTGLQSSRLRAQTRL